MCIAEHLQGRELRGRERPATPTTATASATASSARAARRARANRSTGAPRRRRRWRVRRDSRSCRPGTACAGVNCSAARRATRSTDKCKCGGPGGPTCASNQVCALGPPRQCQGGAQCVAARRRPEDLRGRHLVRHRRRQVQVRRPRRPGVCSLPTTRAPRRRSASRRRFSNVVQAAVRRARTGLPDRARTASSTRRRRRRRRYCAVPTGTAGRGLGVPHGDRVLHRQPRPRAALQRARARSDRHLPRRTATPRRVRAGACRCRARRPATQIAGAPMGFGYCVPQ